MDHADIRARHNDLFRSSAAASHGQQSLSGSNIGTASSSWGGSTKTITGIKRNVAKDLLKSLDKGTDSDSSLSDIGKRSSTRIATSKSHATSTSQLGFFPRQDASTGFYESFHQSLASSSRSTSKVSTSKLSSTTQAAQRQQSTTTKPSPVYKRTSAAGHPFKPPSRVTQEEPQKAKAQLQSHRRKAPAIQHSSDEEEAPERVVRVRDGTKKTRDEEGGKQASRTGEASDERKYDIDICPYIPPADGVHVDSFLFTPPTVEEASTSHAVPRSFASSSSKENETIKAKKQRSPSVTADSDIQYPKLPNFAKKQPAPASDKRKSKRNAYDYDDNIDDDSTYSIPTLSRSLTTSSTGSLEEATSKARIAPTSSTITPKIRRMPEDNKIDQAHEASSCARTPTVSKAIKRGSSAIKPGQDPPQTVRKTSQSEKDIANDAEPRRMRSSSPAIDRRKAARKAKPAAKEKVYSSGSAAYDGSEHKTGVASSSSKSRQDYPQDRRPLTEKAALPSSSKNRKDTAVNVPAYKTKGKGRITDLTSSSPEKSRPITLSSSLHNGINEQDEDSVVVATSSTLREPSRSTYGAPSKAPVSSSVLEAMYTRPVDRGKPSPVFKTKSPKKDQRQAKSDSDRPRAKPAAKPPARPMEYPAPESSSQPRRLATSNTSPKKRAVEVVVEASPAFKKRANGLVKSEVREDEERRTKRRSVEREIQRSDSPFEQTQALWRKAAIGDSFDLDYDVKMEESDSDTDGDVRLTDFQEIVLCPFCDRPLPSRPSKRLKDQLEQLCKRVDLQARASDMNSSALYLPATDTALTCKRHRDESEIIPTGEAAGYPSASSVDWKEIMRRIKRDIVQELTQIINGRTESSFYESVRREWLKSGGRTNPRNDYSSFYLELPGYYGQKGFEVIVQVLTSELVSKDILTPRSAPIDMELYLRRVLVPETAIRLIQADQKCSLSRARKILEDSREYGAAVFSDMDVGDTHYRESQYEQGQRLKEEEEEASQREDILSSQGPEAQALRTGQAFIAKLRKVFK